MSFTDKIRQSIHRITAPVKRLTRLLRRSNIPQEIVTNEQAFEWCQNFLCGTWSTVNIDQMKMERMPGGLSNYLYSCSLSDNIELQENEPRKVLLRIYGESHQKHRGTLLVDSVVCTLLSERKLGPHVYGILPEGRLEEFVEAVSLLVSEVREPKISQQAAKLLADLHQLDMPLIKEPIWLFSTIERYLTDLPIDLHRFEIEEDRQIYQELRTVCNFTQEFDDLKKLLSTIDSPVCFTHNDFQPGNILRLKSQPDNFTVIDFEYCSYNYRGYDIGNHFCEYMFDYISSKEWPHFLVDFTLYPNENQQRNFLSTYLGTTQTLSNENLNQLMKEANYFALAASFFWTLWAINMATSTAIKFGYMEYARARLTAYYLIREKLVGAKELPPRLDEEYIRSEKNPFYQSLKNIDES